MTEPTSEMERAFLEAHDAPTRIAAEILADLSDEPPAREGLFEASEPMIEPEEPDVIIEREPEVNPLELVITAITQIDENIGALASRLEAVEARPVKQPRERRTGAAARVNPDRIQLFYVVLGGVGIFTAAAFAASFGGQYAMAPYTQLPQYLWWVVPLAIEFPLVILSLAVLVFRRRGENRRTVLPWVVMLFLTAVASVVNVMHIWLETGFASPGDYVGAAVMGLMPPLILLSFHIFAQLAVRPEPQTTSPAPARKTPAKKGTTKK